MSKTTNDVKFKFTYSVLKLRIVDRYSMLYGLLNTDACSLVSLYYYTICYAMK